MSSVAELHREMLNTVKTRRLDDLEALFHPDYTYTSSDGAGQPASASIAMVEGYLAAFSDLNFEVTHEFQSGSMSVMEFTARGTNDGVLMGLPPSGRTVEVPICNVIEERDGKIFAEREYFDAASMMAQLGFEGTVASASNQARVAAIYQAFGEGNTAFILDQLADDVAWDTETHNWGIPWYEPRHGKSEVQRFFEVVAAELQFTAFEPVAILANDDHVAAVIRVDLIVKATGKQIQETEVHVWHFGADGMVDTFEHVVDQHAHLVAYKEQAKTTM